MFTITDRILPGSKNIPEIYSMVHNGKISFYISKWNFSLFIPGLSSITGLGLAIAGLIHSIIHLTLLIFDSKHYQHHLEQSKLGLKSIVKGVIGGIPVVGNLFFYILYNCDLEKEFVKSAKHSEVNHYCLETPTWLIGEEHIASNEEPKDRTGGGVLRTVFKLVAIESSGAKVSDHWCQA